MAHIRNYLPLTLTIALPLLAAFAWAQHPVPPSAKVPKPIIAYEGYRKYARQIKPKDIKSMKLEFGPGSIATHSVSIVITDRALIEGFLKALQQAVIVADRELPEQTDGLTLSFKPETKRKYLFEPYPFRAYSREYGLGPEFNKMLDKVLAQERKKHPELKPSHRQ